MQYTWLFIALFFSISAPLSHAETKAGAIKDAEFVIEKQKKNSVPQAQRLFFKAPTPTIKQLNKPLKTLSESKLPAVSFDPAAQLYLPFHLKKKERPPSLHRFCKIGMSISTSLLPYLAVGLDDYPFGKGVWSTNLSFIPALWGKKSKEASFDLQGRYDVGAWRFQPHLSYQPVWYTYSGATLDSCMIHQGNMSLLVKQASESSTQYGQVNIQIMDYLHRNLNEKLCTLHYTWVKRLDNWSLKVASYQSMAQYANGADPATRFIFSATPSLCLHLYKAMQFKMGLRMAYHNDSISGIHDFDPYPIFKIGYEMATWLRPYIGIEGMGIGGSVVPLHLHDVVAKNPFIASNAKLSHRHQYCNLYGGSKGMMLSKLSYRLHIAYRQLKNQSRIVKDAGGQIRLAYNPRDYKLVKVMVLVDYGMPGRKYHATIKGSCYPYVEEQPFDWWYHKPRYKLKPTLTYKPHAKVLVSSNLHLYGPTTVKDLQGKPTEIGRRINLSLGIDYFIFNKFVASLVASNLLNRTYMGYTGYPDQPFNLMIGLAYKW